VTEDALRARIEALYQRDGPVVRAALIRLLGDFDLAEEALHDAFAAALQTWPAAGIPERPRAWLVSAGRFQAVETLRRRARFDAALAELAERIAADARPEDPDEDAIEDDRLRLIFTCCHPLLPPEASMALTLREVCGLTTEAIARAFLATAPTIAQRIVRAKAKLKEARVPFEVPGRSEMAARLDAVLRVVYLLFNEGYAAASGTHLTRADLCREAIRLGRLLVELLDEPEAQGLLGLMLLHDARRAARVAADGRPVLLADQDRSLWNRTQIEEGAAWTERALRSRRFGPYTLQAAIAAVHAEAEAAAATDWAQIVGLYDVLLRVEPSPVVELNRAVAVGMRDGPAAGLALVEAILATGRLADYVPAHAARADLCERAGRLEEARAAFAQALRLAKSEPERRFFAERLARLGPG